jgi:hypothetical protein
MTEGMFWLAATCITASLAAIAVWQLVLAIRAYRAAKRGKG